MSRLFLGNVPHSASETDIIDWLQSHGYTVESIDVITDRNTGLRRGFCFVTLQDNTQAEDAVRKLHGMAMRGRPITVNFAVPLRPKDEGPEVRGAA
ncbi:MAG TPA: RNA-binding protein [Terriglobia bacterium]|nr:RNA-binding protein [Terriglobia bacterium]